MTPDPPRIDPLAPAALVAVVLSVVLACTGPTVGRLWLLATIVGGGALGGISLVRIGRSQGRLRGELIAIAAIVAGWGLAALPVLSLVCLLGVGMTVSDWADRQPTWDNRATMQCDYFDAGVCRSCHLLDLAYADQLARKQAQVGAALAAVAPGVRWEEPVRSADAAFRNKAKMVVAGTLEAPTLGILGPGGTGVDLLACRLHSPGLQAALPVLAEFVRSAGLTPYSVSERRGELKHLIVTESPDGELMVRWVLRSTEALARLRKHLPELLAALPVAVASVNLQPEHKAILEGPDEILLTEHASLTMRINGIGLRLRPQSFFQTNTDVAAALYRHARDLVRQAAPVTVWDLYCGVGGFGLHVAEPGRTVVGVESSEQAIESARLTADALASTVPAPGQTEWHAADATSWALGSPHVGEPDLVIVNPPRRGIGAELSGWLESSGVGHVVYSSCNVDSLARDLARMPSMRPASARLLDMFPHTEHHEVLVLLERR